MAPESCNLGKDEAEILKPSSPSSSSSSSSSPSNTSPSSTSSQFPPQPAPPILVKELCHQDQSPDERPETPIVNSIKASSLLKLEEEPYLTVPFGNRCSTCQKRIGLTGFRCRCGDLFCAQHRYSDTHGCSFDYKAAGREEISKANPVIRAAKIIKI